MSSKKGQAAMEYLMTYGWALVALVVVIAALMATGAFNPSYLIGEECTLQPDLSCGPHIMYLDGGEPVLKFRVNNGLGYDIWIADNGAVDVETSDQGHHTDYNLLDPDGTPANNLVEQGSAVVIEVPLNGLNAVKGEIQRMKLSLTYTSCAPEVIGTGTCPADGSQHIISGRVIARVEEKT